MYSSCIIAVEGARMYSSCIIAVEYDRDTVELIFK